MNKTALWSDMLAESTVDKTAKKTSLLKPRGESLYLPDC